MNIVERIAKLLKLDEKGKLEKFFTRLTKQLKRDAESLKHNLAAINFEFSAKMQQLKDSLEDAIVAASDSLDNVPVEVLNSNQSMDEYFGTYLDNIKRADQKVTSIEQKIKKLTEDNQFQIKEIETKIEKITNLLEKLK